MDDKIEKVKKIASKEAASKVMDAQEELQRVYPNKERFDNMMQAPPKAEDLANNTSDPSKKTSLMDEVRTINSGSEKPTRVTPTELIAQTEQVIGKMEDLRGQLAAGNVAIKESAVPLLRNKLSHVNESIRVALSHAGTEFPETPVAPVASKQNPISRFLGLLTDGQYKLQRLSQDVEGIAGTSLHDINPAKLLLIQIKVGQIQQEIELFSALLNQSLQSIKTVMNVQV
jgi:hypothetical protein